MSISRRQFILGTAAGLILPSYYDKVLTYFEIHGEPLIEASKQANLNLYAVDWHSEGFQLQLGGVATEPPGPMTVGAFAEKYFGGEDGYLHDLCYERDEVDFNDIEDEDMVHTTWRRRDSPMARAYRLLENLDLGPDFDSEDAVGHLEFLDCPGMCSDYLGVDVCDEVSISLLQKRLNELNTGVRISMVEADHV